MHIELLLVDDDPMAADFTRALLPLLDPGLEFEVTWASSAQAGLQAVREHDFEVMLLDYHMPDGDGLSVLAQVRRLPLAQQPAVIMLTGSGSEMLAVEAMKGGARDYLSKERLDIPSLLRAITSALAQRRLEQQVEHYTSELQAKNVQLEADLNMAREFQFRFLTRRFPTFPPGVPPRESELIFFPQYRPTGRIGGDFYDVLQLADHEAGVFICDVMGHGVRAALVTGILRGLVEQLKHLARDPGAFLSHINATLVEVLEQTDTPLFATAFYLTANLQERVLRYSNAGHPIPLLVRRGAGTVTPLPDGAALSGAVLGLDRSFSYQTLSCELQPRDLVVLYTDGIFEVPGPGHEEYGEERLVEAIRSRMHQNPGVLFEDLLAEIQQFAADHEFCDDVCLVAIEAAGK